MAMLNVQMRPKNSDINFDEVEMFIEHVIQGLPNATPGRLPTISFRTTEANLRTIMEKHGSKIEMSINGRY